MGRARGAVDCSSGDEVTCSSPLYTLATIRRANVGSNEQSFVDAFNTRCCRSSRVADPRADLSVTWRRNQHHRRRAMSNANLGETAPTQFQDIGGGKAH